MPLNLQVDSDLTSSTAQTVRDQNDNASPLALNQKTVQIDTQGTLAVQGAMGVQDDQKLHFGIPGQSGDGEWLQNAKSVADQPGFGIAMFAGGHERLRVLGDGKVAIGTFEPQSMLQVEGDVRVGGVDPNQKPNRLVFDDSTSGASARTEEWIQNLGSDAGQGLAFYAGGSERMRIDADGKVGIGTSDKPVADIELSGSVAMPKLPGLQSSGVADLIVDASGNVTPQSSSLRFKESVEVLDIDFQKILSLEPKRFVYRDSGHPGIGFLAEEVDAQEELRELVTYDAEGAALGVQYKMVPVYLLEVVKQQQEQIEALRADVETLRKRLESASSAQNVPQRGEG